MRLNKEQKAFSAVDPESVNEGCPLVFGCQFGRFAFSPRKLNLPRAIEGEARFKRRCTSSCISFLTYALLTDLVRSRWLYIDQDLFCV